MNKANKTGDYGEVSFLREAIARGYTVCKPFGVSYGYDFLLDTGNNLYKVQVKASNRTESKKCHSPYKFGTGSKLANSDVLVCYKITTDEWYLFPATDVPENGVCLPDGKSKFDVYKNNWSVFK